MSSSTGSTGAAQVSGSRDADKPDPGQTATTPAEAAPGIIPEGSHGITHDNHQQGASQILGPSGGALAESASPEPGPLAAQTQQLSTAGLQAVGQPGSSAAERRASKPPASVTAPPVEVQRNTQVGLGCSSFTELEICSCIPVLGINHLTHVRPSFEGHEWPIILKRLCDGCQDDRHMMAVKKTVAAHLDLQFGQMRMSDSAHLFGGLLKH